MTRTERIQWQIFVLLVVAIAASIYYFSKSSTENPIKTDLKKPSAKPGTAAPDNLPKVSTLQGKLPEFKNVQRNVFEFAGEPSESTDVTSLQPVLPEPQTMPLLVPIGPDVTYLAFYKEKEGSNRKLAAISNGGQIYVGGVGEVLAGKYRVIQVEDEFIEVEYLPEKRVIRLELGRHDTAPPLD